MSPFNTTFSPLIDVVALPRVAMAYLAFTFKSPLISTIPALIAAMPIPSATFTPSTILYKSIVVFVSAPMLTLALLSGLVSST